MEDEEREGSSICGGVEISGWRLSGWRWREFVLRRAVERGNLRFGI